MFQNCFYFNFLPGKSDNVWLVFIHIPHQHVSKASNFNFLRDKKLKTTFNREPMETFSLPHDLAIEPSFSNPFYLKGTKPVWYWFIHRPQYRPCLIPAKTTCTCELYNTIFNHLSKFLEHIHGRSNAWQFNFQFGF